MSELLDNLTGGQSAAVAGYDLEFVQRGAECAVRTDAQASRAADGGVPQRAGRLAILVNEEWW